MLLTDPCALHGVLMEIVGEAGRPVLEAWISGQPPAAVG
jgi:hypothetical protein